MTHKWNYRITFKQPNEERTNITVQYAGSREQALAQAQRHVFGFGNKVSILKIEVKHTFGWVNE